jgi:hypothetical protein
MPGFTTQSELSSVTSDRTATTVPLNQEDVTSMLSDLSEASTPEWPYGPLPPVISGRLPPKTAVSTSEDMYANGGAGDITKFGSDIRDAIAEPMGEEGPSGLMNFHLPGNGARGSGVPRVSEAQRQARDIFGGARLTPPTGGAPKLEPSVKEARVEARLEREKELVTAGVPPASAEATAFVKAGGDGASADGVVGGAFREQVSEIEMQDMKSDVRTIGSGMSSAMAGGIRAQARGGALGRAFDPPPSTATDIPTTVPLRGPPSSVTLGNVKIAPNTESLPAESIGGASVRGELPEVKYGVGGAPKTVSAPERHMAEVDPFTARDFGAKETITGAGRGSAQRSLSWTKVLRDEQLMAADIRTMTTPQRAFVKSMQDKLRASNILPITEQESGIVDQVVRDHHAARRGNVGGITRQFNPAPFESNALSDRIIDAMRKFRAQGDFRGAGGGGGAAGG